MTTIPLTPSDLLTVGGLGIVVALLIQFLVKPFLSDKRILNVLCIVLALVIAVIITAIQGTLTGNGIVSTLLLGLAAGVSASGLYETITNIAGKLGVGPRTDESYLANAVADVFADKASHELVVALVKREINSQTPLTLKPK